MGLRFRKSIKIMPGVRVNVGLKGSSITVGPRGASVSLGKQGIYSNTSIPGTGLSFRNKLGGASPKMPVKEASTQNVEIKISLEDDGSVSLLNQNGEVLSRSLVSKIWQSNGNVIGQWLQEQIDSINDMELIDTIHLDMPPPNKEPVLEEEPFLEETPKKPVKYQVDKPFFLWMLFSSKTKENYHNALESAEYKHIGAMKKWEAAVESWAHKKELHKQEQEALRLNYGDRIKTDIDFMTSVLENTLQKLRWPRETLVSLEITLDAKQAWIDVDLPEIEDIPQKTASLSASGKKLNIKEKSQKQLRLDYARHIHGIGLRVAAYTFASLPSVDMVVLSGFSQRLDRSTGKVSDEYLYSIKFDRETFSQINFGDLKQLDPVAAFDRFENRRKMTSTGIFKAIEPFGISD